MKRPYQATVRACFTGYIVQAIVNNFAPLLFLTFSSHYQIPIAQITFLVTFNFGLQLLVDLLSAGLIVAAVCFLVWKWKREKKEHATEN